MQVSELIQKADKITSPEEIEETSTAIGETLGGLISAAIDFHTIAQLF